MFTTGKIPQEQMVDRREKLSFRDFLHEYAIPGRPVLLTGMMEEWQATDKWTLDFFKTRYGSLIVPACQGSDAYELELGDYIRYITEVPPEDRALNRLYVRDWYFSHQAPELLDDYRIPPHFKSLLRYIPESFQAPYRWLYLGMKGTGTAMHRDVDMTHAWNAVFQGVKQWVFFSPDQTDFLHGGRVNAFAPDLEKYPRFAKASPLYAIQHPGEIIYTPSGWWHQVVNTETTLALTENFVDETNFEAYLRAYSKRFLKNRKI